MGGETDKATKPKFDYPRYVPGPVGKRITNIYKDRIQQFTAEGQWQNDNLLAYVLRPVNVP